MSLPQIHHYPLLEGSSAILNLLRPSLPISLPLYRRIQFQHFTAFSYLLCSLSPTDLEPPSVSPKKTWIAAFVDRSRRPETEVWVFGSWESMPGDEGREKDQEKEKDELVMGLVAEIGKLAGAEVAEIDHGGAGTNGAENEEEGEGQGSDLTADGEGAEKSGAKRVGRGEYNAHMKGTRIVLVGSVHEKTVDVMRRVGVIAEGFVGAHIPYRKYMFDISRKSSSSLPQPKPLPEGLYWGHVKSEHFPLVRSRTQIPRQDRTMIQLPSVAVYPSDPTSGDPAPVSWAFLGGDASLTTLHVEPEHRGRGLAKAVAMKLFAEDMQSFVTHGDLTEEDKDKDRRWAHADVAVDNDASIGVCTSLGGKWEWQVYWVRIDLEKQRSQVGFL